MYIFRFLHQTTTARVQSITAKSCISFVFYIKPQRCFSGKCDGRRCISFVFYIKPQLLGVPAFLTYCCISFVFYIKPQPRFYIQHGERVVYLSFSTSNHNNMRAGYSYKELYIFRFLHQTTTNWRSLRSRQCCISFVFYIKPQLLCVFSLLVECCISFVFYIKPQLLCGRFSGTRSCISFVFYIKPQLQEEQNRPLRCCISFVFYIKPQLDKFISHLIGVVYLSFSTSNHNYFHQLVNKIIVVYLSFSTSNHNTHLAGYDMRRVVYLSFSTSNHNLIFLLSH